MKGIAIQLIASSVALVVMGGAVGVHWWDLEISGDLKPGSGWHVLSVPREDEGGMVSVSTGGSMPVPSEMPASARGRVSSDVDSATVEALQEVVSVLRDMKAENERLEEQLREINGELNGMQIQIEGYSDEFRPLTLAPTREGVIDSGNPLLPPKRW